MAEISVINEKELGKAIVDNLVLKLGVPAGENLQGALQQVLSGTASKLLDTHYLALRVQKDADGSWGIAAQANRKEPA